MKREAHPFSKPQIASSLRSPGGPNIKGQNHSRAVFPTVVPPPHKQANKLAPRTVIAPPAYRPLPVPRVLQTKASPFAQRPGNQSQPQIKVTQQRRETAKPLIRFPQTRVSRPATPVQKTLSTPVQLRAKTAGVQPGVVKTVSRPPRAFAPPNAGRGTVQRFAASIVQATKFYPNLHPGAVEPVEPGNVFKLRSFADQYRLHKVKSHGVNVPNQQYNFVRTREGETLMHSRYRHPSIAEGKQVLYAGEIFFNNGKLQWWSNGSGHYQPAADDAEQANLPMDSFFSYQQIIKGEHTRKKG
jgi:hypothetical protein